MNIFDDIYIDPKYITIIYPHKVSYISKENKKHYHFGISVSGIQDIIYTIDFDDEWMCEGCRKQFIEHTERSKR